MISVLVVWSAVKSVCRLVCTIHIEFLNSEKSDCLSTSSLSNKFQTHVKQPYLFALWMREGAAQRIAWSEIHLRNMSLQFLQFKCGVGGRRGESVMCWNIYGPQPDDWSIHSIVMEFGKLISPLELLLCERKIQSGYSVVRRFYSFS